MNKHVVKTETVGLDKDKLKVRMKMFQAKQPDPEVVTITPDEALFMLEEHNGFNRPVSYDTVKFYADQMRRGLWQINGEPIIISDQGDLLNGQHRLYACVEAGVSFRTILVKGITAEAFKTIDQGRKRTAGDIIAIAARHKGENSWQAGTIAAAAGICIEYERGWLKKKGTGGAKVSGQEKLAFVEAHPELLEWTKEARAQKGSLLSGHASIIAAVCYLGSKKYEMKAKTFLKAVLSGENLESKSPALALQHKFLENAKLRLHRWEKIAYTALAWNKHVANEKILILKLPQDGEVPAIAGAVLPGSVKVK